MAIKKVGIAGGGIMGSGIAQLCASNSFNVILYDVGEQFLEKSMAGIAKNLQKLVEKQKISLQQKEDTLSRIKTVTDINSFRDADIIIEAIVENMDAKKELFKACDEICRPEVILCTNTSSMSVTSIAGVTKRPEKVCGLHFFNPPTIMKLVEIIRGYDTCDDTIKTVKDFSQCLGKETVEVCKDTPGFVVNRILFPHFLEAIRIYEEGVASKEDIDKAVKLGLNYPMGPFELMDFGGLDTLVHVTEYFFAETKENRWNLPQIARNVIRSGRYGKKSGKGWYNYD